MKIAILSDIHDNIWNLEKVLEKIKNEKVDAIIFCGDFCAPFIFRKLADFGLPVYAVFGNVDGAQKEITDLAIKKYRNITLEKDLLEIELGKRKIAICHNNQFAEGLAKTGKYDAVFYGHTHTSKIEKIDKILLANPGEIHSVITGKCTFGIYDTDINEIEIKEVVK
jgi:putative phosphoesterase